MVPFNLSTILAKIDAAASPIAKTSKREASDEMHREIIDELLDPTDIDFLMSGTIRV